MKKKVATIATAAVMSSTLSTTVFADSNTYSVQPGDTLYKIASKYQYDLFSDLKTQNQLSSDTIFVNQTLTSLLMFHLLQQLQASTSNSTTTTAASVKTYTVVSGDTLIKIANQHGISLAELKLWNRIESSYDLPRKCV